MSRRREDGHVLRRALEFEGQGMNGRPKMTRMRQLKEKCMMISFILEDVLC